MIIWKKNGGGTRKGSLTIIMWNITQIRQEGPVKMRTEGQTVMVISIFPKTVYVCVGRGGGGGGLNNN